MNRRTDSNFGINLMPILPAVYGLTGFEAAWLLTENAASLPNCWSLLLNFVAARESLTEMRSESKDRFCPSSLACVNAENLFMAQWQARMWLCE